MIQRMTISQRKQLPIHPRLDRQLIAYAAAATAAGVGMLAAPQSAEAKVVYTAANVAIRYGMMPIDLDNDGNPDFVIRFPRCAYRSNCLIVNPWVEGNGIKGLDGRASAGVSGMAIGPQGHFLTQLRQFQSYASYGYVGFMVNAGAYGSGSWSGGPWADTTNRYMGLRFLINGEVHYGWARMSVRLLRDKIRLTGYAYETIPNHQITAGQTQDLTAENSTAADPLSPSSNPATLGILARGSDGLTIWRRDDEIISTVRD
jgi:hypothetical protein